MTNFGTDLSLPLSGALVSGLDLLRQSVARRLRTRKGALWYDPTFGTSLPDYLGESYRDGGAELAAVVEMELEEDERLQAASVAVLEAGLRSVTLQCDISSAAGPFSLVCSASQAADALTPDVEVAPYGIG